MIRQKTSQVTAFVLHARAYQESSQIFQVFSHEQGRFSLIAKGIKGKSSQAKKALLQPFIQLDITYAGKSELKTLVQCEVASHLNTDHSNTSDSNSKQSNHQHLTWQGKALACGYYANELVLRACPEKYEFPELFDSYQDLIRQLNENVADDNQLLYPVLRKFEVTLLTVLGIAPDWEYDIEQQPILADKNYQFIAKQGFALNRLSSTAQESANQEKKMHNISGEFSGQSILSLASGEYDSQHHKSTQRITQLLLREVIGDRPLQSRKLWQHMNLKP